jgi:hypothetical protein
MSKVAQYPRQLFTRLRGPKKKKNRCAALTWHLHIPAEARGRRCGQSAATGAKVLACDLESYEYVVE